MYIHIYICVYRHIYVQLIIELANSKVPKPCKSDFARHGWLLLDEMKVNSD